ncbi:Uncharacterised protein [Vibrio cholerae]|nr:Uncharacterised protein [Vibrio cholerae]
MRFIFEISIARFSYRLGRCGRTRLKHPTLTAFVHSF